MNRLSCASLALMLLSCEAHGQEAPRGPERDLVFEPDYFRAAAPATALDMVRRVPGFVIDGGAAVRGYAGAAGNVLIDGARPSTKNETIDALLQAIPASQVARIELVRGERAGLDRQGVQLLVNVVRKTAGTATRTYTLSGYAYPDGAVRPALRVENTRRTPGGGWQGSILLSTNQDESGTGTRVRRAADGSEIERARDSIESPIAGAEARLSGDLPFAGGTLRGNGSLTWQDYRTHERLAFATGPAAGTTARTDDRIRTTSGEIGTEWTRRLGASLTAKLLALGTRKHVVTGSGSDEGGTASDYRGDSLADERIVRVALNRPAGRGLGWEAGGEIAYNALGSRARLDIGGAPFPLPGADVKVSERRGDLFVRLKSSPARGLLAEATLRGEASSLRQRDRTTGADYARHFGFLKPKLTLQWDADRRTQLRLRAERVVGQLDFSDFASSASLIEKTINAGNAALRPQTGWTLEAAWERRFASDGVVTLTGRHELIDNVLDRVPIDDLDAPGNIGRGTISAAALRLSWPLDRLGIGGARLNFDGERRWSSVRDPVTGEQRRISGKSPFSGTLRATLDRPRLKSSWAFDVYFGETYTYRRIDEVRTTRDQPYASLKWTWRPTPRLTIETSAENLLARRRSRNRALYDARRDTGAILFTERRVYRSRTGLFLSIRYQ